MPQEQQNIRRWLVRLTGPIFIEMVLIILLGIVDTVMLSQCSDNTVAAVGARWTTYSAPSAYRWPSI